MGLSTLEPRKNFSGLIAAWTIARQREAPDLKLVIVGKPGWFFEETLRAMQPHVEAGNLYHLEDLPIGEVQAMYRNARAVVFPSFAEGFGFPPMEGLMCGTPAVVSDLPVHREVMGDAVLYADPYDAEAIADQILRLAGPRASPDLREQLVANGRQILKRYEIATVTDHWLSLFDRLKAGGPTRAAG